MSAPQVQKTTNWCYHVQQRGQKTLREDNMDPLRNMSPEPAGLPKLGRHLFALGNLLLGAMGLVVVILYILEPRQVGCIDHTYSSLLALPFSLCAIGVGHLRRSKLGYWSGYAGALMMLFSLAIPPFNPGTPDRNHASAVGSLRDLNAAETAYEATYHNGYSPSLRSLGPPPDGGRPSGEAADLIDTYLAGGERPAYYHIEYSPGPRDANGHINAYTITANPIQHPNGGNYYFIDQTGVVRQNSSRPATAADPLLAG